MNWFKVPLTSIFPWKQWTHSCLFVFFTSLQWIFQSLWEIVFIHCTCLCWWQKKHSLAEITHDILLSFTLQSQMPCLLLTPSYRTFTPRYQLHVFVSLLSWSFSVFLFFCSMDVIHLRLAWRATGGSRNENPNEMQFFTERNCSGRMQKRHGE